ncbi:uncharacterized protein LOC128204972 [Mya arenaria]|uniref:uncharacterized protein LOC128204972 n=1 Tax=Mya arenaria TaxID=6604 RepID=UPI0022E24C08|nr:uncharacterized protein LOC128204972 [Mya arenaria]
MTRRTKQDYVAVLRAVKERLGDPIVEWFMLDFEAAAWQAVREVFPNTVVKGCSFHWSQRVYRKVSRLGLAPAYTQKGGVYHFVRKLLALPYLPAEHVRPAFLTLREQAVESESERILDLVDYIGLHRKKYRSTHEKLHQAWEKYEEDNMTTNQLLRTASHIIGLGPIATSAENYSEDE